MLFLPFYFFTLLLLSNDTSLGVLNEVDDILYFRGNLQVLLDFLDTFFQHALRVEKAVSLMNLLNEFVAETAAAKAYQVECAVSCWLLTGNDIWRNVL